MAKKGMNERTRSDFVVKLKNVSAVLSWFLGFGIFVLLGFARPPVRGFFDRQYDITFQQSWNMMLVQYAYFLMYPLVLICIIGLIANASRHKRKYDTYSASLIVLGLLGILGIVYFLNLV